MLYFLDEDVYICFYHIFAFDLNIKLHFLYHIIICYIYCYFLMEIISALNCYVCLMKQQFFPMNDEEDSRQPETRAIMNWLRDIRFTASATLHGVFLLWVSHDSSLDLHYFWWCLKWAGMCISCYSSTCGDPAVDQGIWSFLSFYILSVFSIKRCIIQKPNYTGLINGYKIKLVKEDKVGQSYWNFFIFSEI